MTQPAPRTGHAEIDAALARLEELAQLPVNEHHDLLAGVHETLHRVLHDRSES